LPPIVVYRHHHRCCHCRQAAITSTATTVVKLAIIHCQKKEATAAAPPAYQQQHQRENVYKSRPLDLFNLSAVSREFSNYQVVSLKKMYLFCDVHTRRCLALRLWELLHDKKAIPTWDF
jgi:hypothetical protein